MPDAKPPTADHAAYLLVTGASKRFGSFTALDEVSFHIEPGEFVCFLGPSGCGKTTMLRCIAGLESLSGGRIVQAGRDITGLPPAARDFGIVFQSYALFPNLSVRDNIAFGLVSLGRRTDEVARRVNELLELVGLPGEAARYPGQLSGGQQQRVALARALAPSPGLLLLDEPLSALDAKVRLRLRREIKRLQRQVGVTTIMVTHDQEEALTMADRILVMRQGRVEQIGTPAQVYDEPASPFVADFIGATNLLNATVVDMGKAHCGGVELLLPAHGHASGASIVCAIRPEHAQIKEPGTAAAEPGTTLQARVQEIERLGSFSRVHLLAGTDPAEISMDLREGQATLALLAPGNEVSLRLPARHLRTFARPQ
jgi:iron(III) transport system ATP-binding protein